MSTATLLISAPDQRGITASITDFIYQNNGNIEHADQHIDSESNTFFMRIEWSLTGFAIASNQISEKFQPLAAKFSMNWSIFFNSKREKIAIFVSRQTHCLYDLLYKRAQGYLNCDISLIVSNHKTAKPIAKHFNIPFYYFPKQAKNKQDTEEKEIDLVKKNKIDLIVLARYMQIFSERFVEEFKNRVINIHHSFLPAFAGGDPYRQAYRCGVKIIGATSHYISKELDSGPIIEQDTVGVSHRDSLIDFKRKGEDLERIVLSRAVRLHLNKKILAYDNKTVVFD